MIDKIVSLEMDSRLRVLDCSRVKLVRGVEKRPYHPDIIDQVGREMGNQVLRRIKNISNEIRINPNFYKTILFSGYVIGEDGKMECRGMQIRKDNDVTYLVAENMAESLNRLMKKQEFWKVNHFLFDYLKDKEVSTKLPIHSLHYATGISKFDGYGMYDPVSADEDQIPNWFKRTKL